MDQQVVLLTMVGMLVVTYLPRLMPLWLLASRPLPPVIVAWLRYVPVAVLSALLMPSLVLRNGALALTPDNLYLWAAVPTFVVAWKTKSLFGSVAVGMLVVAAVRFLTGA